jgi:hypothetical protein
MPCLTTDKTKSSKNNNNKSQVQIPHEASTSWAVDFATSAHAASTDTATTPDGLNDPLIQKLFRIFLVFTDELDTQNNNTDTIPYRDCIARKHQLHVNEVRALCALLAREIGIFDLTPSANADDNCNGGFSQQAHVSWLNDAHNNQLIVAMWHRLVTVTVRVLRYSTTHT